MTVIYIIIFVILLYSVISLYLISRSHEQCHYEIFAARGYKPIMTITSCEVPDEQIKEQDKQDINKMNDFADIIQYHAQVYYFGFMGLVGIVLCFVAYFIGK